MSHNLKTGMNIFKKNAAIERLKGLLHPMSSNRVKNKKTSVKSVELKVIF